MSSIISWFIRRRNNLCIRFIKEGDAINILVIGGSGFIGSHIVDKLIENNYDVKVFDVNPPIQKNVEFIKGSITSLKDLNHSMKDVDGVYHLAAISNINVVVKNPLEAINLNILGTANVLESCRNSKVNRVIIASSYIVDTGKGHIYATSKTASEMICKNYYGLYGLPYTILRYGSVYGPRSRGVDVISIIVKKALSNETFTIQGDGKQSRNFVYVENLAEGNVLALKNIAKNKTYTLEGSTHVTISDVIKIIEKFIGPIKIKYEYARIDDFTKQSTSDDNAKKELKWNQNIDIEEGIKRYIWWYKNEQ